MSKKRSGKDSLPVSNDREVGATSDEDVIILDVDDSFDDMVFPDISVKKKKNAVLHHNSSVSGRPSTSTAVGSEKAVGATPRPGAMTKAVHSAKKSGPSVSERRDFHSTTPNTGGLAKAANRARVGASQKHHLPSSTPQTVKKKQTTPLSPVGAPGASPERGLHAAGHSGSVRKPYKAGESDPQTMGTHSQRPARFLDCMDLFTPSPAGRPGERCKQSNSTPRAGHGKERPGKRHDILSSSGTLVRAKIGEKRRRKHSHEFEGGRSVTPNSEKAVRLSLREELTRIGSRETSVPSTSKTLPKGGPTSTARERPGSALSKHGSQSRGGQEKVTNKTSGVSSIPPAASKPSSVASKPAPVASKASLSASKSSSVASKSVPPVRTSPQPVVKSAQKNGLSPTKSFGTATKLPSLSPTNSRAPLSPPPVPRKHSSAPKIITLQPLQQNHSDSSVDPGLSPTNKDSETGTSPMFDFNDTDLFEVLDSVESESICSAYNQSDSESVGVTSDNKPTSESEPHQPSKLVTSHTCRSPSESSIHDFAKSFVKRKRKRPQVARKSTTLNGVKLYKHPVRGKGRVHMNRYCTISLIRLKNSVVQKARKDFARHTDAKKSAIEASTLPRLIKKREKKNSNSTSAAKRIKLSSGKPLTTPVVADPGTSRLATPPPVSVSHTSQPKTSLQIPLTEQSQEMGKKEASKPKQKVGSAPKKAVQFAPQEQAPKPVSTEKQSVGEKNNSLPKRQENHVLSPTSSKPNPSLSPHKSGRPLPLILQRPKNRSLVSQVSGGDQTDVVSPIRHVFSPPSAASPVRQRGSNAPATLRQEKSCVSESVTPVSNERHQNHSVLEQLLEKSKSPTDTVPIAVSSQLPSVENSERGVRMEGHTSKATHRPSQSAEDSGELVNEAQGDGGASDQGEHAKEQNDSVPLVVQEAERGSVVGREVEPIASTLHSLQAGPSNVPKESPEASKKPSSALAKLSQRDEAYDMRLLETIAKFAPAPETTATNNRKHSSSSSSNLEHMEVGINKSSEGEVVEQLSLTVKLPIAQLSRVPATSPVVITRPLGMFRDASVQAERGMIIDKDVLDNYLVVKLSEAMFDMKAQLQMMEAQVASIAKQKESLERTLQAKAQYIRDMTTTGFKPAMVDKGTLTDQTPLSPEQRHPRTPNDSLSPVRGKPKARKNVKTQEKGVQTRPKMSTVSSQTDGFLRSVPSRLQGQSHTVCLYNYPESELQLFIEEGKRSVVHPSDSLAREDGTKETIAGQGHKWLTSRLVEGECSRSVGVSPKVRFLKAIESSSESQSCPRCSGVQIGSRQTEVTASDMCTCSNVEASGESNSAANHEVVTPDLAKVCFTPPLHAAISRLSELYFKLKALPKEPVQERHMASVLEAVHHLLAHLPIELKSPTPATPLKPTSATSPQSLAPTGTSSTPTSLDTPSTPVVSPPPSTEKPASSPPSTPGAASWAMGAKMQELVDVLQELDDKGKEVFPLYFKAELAQLQKKAKKTLIFLTVGLRHETFSHDKSGCIVDSDIQLRPWRNRDLHINPFFHRLFLDVGIRGLLQEVKRLMKQNRKGRRLGQESSEEDSDLELLCSPPSSPKSRLKTPATASSSRVRKRKVVKTAGKKLKKSSTSKGERIRQLVAAKKNDHNYAIPAPPSSKHTSTGSTRPPSDSPPNLAPDAMSTNVTNTSSSKTANTATSATALPLTTAAVSSPLTSPSRTSPYSKLITKGESFQVRLGELQSSVKTPHQPPAVSSGHKLAVTSSIASSKSGSDSFKPVASTPCNVDALGGDLSAQLTMAQCIQHASQRLAPSVSTTLSTSQTSLSSKPIASIPCNVDALGGNLSAQLTVAQCIQHASQRLAPSVSTTLSTSQTSLSSPLVASSTSSTAKPLSSAAISHPQISTATPCASTPAPTTQSSAVAPITASASGQTLPRFALQNALETLTTVLHKVHMTPGEKEALSSLISRSLRLSRSTYAIDLHMAQLLINQVTQQLHMRAPSAWFCGGNSVQVRQLSPFMSYAYPTRSTFSASPNIVTPLSLPMIIPLPPLPAIQPPVRSLSITQSAPVQIEVCPNTAVVSSMTTSQPLPIQAATVAPSNTHSNMVSLAKILPSVLTPPASVVALPAASSTHVVTTIVNPKATHVSVLTTGVQTVQTTLDKQEPTTAARATLSTNTSTTAACGDVRMSPSVAAATAPAIAPVAIQKDSLPGVVVPTAPPNTSEQVVVHCPRVSHSAEPISPCKASLTSPKDSGEVWQGIANLRENVLVHKSLHSTKDTSQDGKSAPPANTSTSVAKLPSATSSLPPSIPTSSSAVADTTVTASGVRNAALSASSIIGVLKEITPLLSYIDSTSTSSASISSAPRVTTASSASPTTSTAANATPTVPSAANTKAVVPTNTKGTTISTAYTTTANTKATTVFTANTTTAKTKATSTSTAHTTTADTKATVPSMASTKANIPARDTATFATNPKTTVSLVSSNTSTPCTTSETAALIISASAPSSKITSIAVPNSTPISTSAQISNTSISPSTSSTSNNSPVTAISIMATSTNSARPTLTAVARLSQSQVTPGSRGPTPPIQSRPQRTTVNTASSFLSSSTLPPSTVHVPPASSLDPLSQQNLPVVKLQATKVFTGLVIKWTFSQEDLSWQTFVERYDLYAFVSSKMAKIPDVSLWGKVGEIKPMALPMAVTLTNFAIGQRYAFAVKVRYVGGVTSRYSNPCTIDL